MDAPVWDATTYSKNRDRLVAGDVAARFLQAVLHGARVRRLLSDEHFSVDGTLIEAWASMKSFRRKDDGGDPPAGRNAERDFRGERCSNATHASTTDADARLFRKGEGQSALRRPHSLDRFSGQPRQPRLAGRNVSNNPVQQSMSDCPRPVV